MIEPLRFCHEISPTYEVTRPAYCIQCLSQRQTKNNPNIAIFYCKECPNLLGESKEYGAFLCRACEIDKHKVAQNRFHARQIVVVGPGLRKKMKVRGDGVCFPFLLDTVTVKVKARIFSNHQRIHTEKSQEISFTTGLSGKCLHVQILGARNLNVADNHFSSDPFVVYSFYGKPIASTRVKQRTVNPRWDNETFVVPMSDCAPLPREYVPTQKEMIKLEVYDHDWISSNEFLGHVEMTRSKLMKLALISQEQPIRIPLTAKEYNGIINFQFGFNQDDFVVKILSAEDLDKSGAGGMNNPYVKLFLHDKLLGSTPIMSHTIHPTWNNHNEFTIKLAELLEKEYFLLAQLKYYRASVGLATAVKRRQRGAFVYKKEEDNNMLFDEFQSLPDYLALFRFEVYHSNGLPSIIRKDPLIGKLCVHCEQYRRILPNLPLPESQLTERLQSSTIISQPSNSITQEQKTFVQTTTTAKIATSLKHFLPNVEITSRNPPPPPLSSDFTESADKTKIENLISSLDYPNNVSTIQEAEHHIPVPLEPSNSDDSTGTVDAANITSRPASRMEFAFNTARQMVHRTFLRVNNPQQEKQYEWTTKQRLPLIRKSTKKTKEVIDEYGQEDYGFIIIRLLISNRGKVIAGLDEAVQRMTIGETSMVKCRFDYAYGNYCFDKSIPPRSNVIFTVQLLAINGQGRWGIFVRQLRRLWRILFRTIKEIFRFFWFCGKYESPIDNDKKKKKRKKKKKKKTESFLKNYLSSMSRLVTGSMIDTTGKDDESSSDDDDDSDEEGGSSQSSDDSNGDSDERESVEEDAEKLQELYQVAEEDSLLTDENIAGKRKTVVKMDPKMKMHWNKSVKAGASLLWKLPAESKRVLPPSLSEKLNSLNCLENIDEEAANENDWENMNEEAIDDRFDKPQLKGIETFEDGGDYSERVIGGNNIENED